MTAAKVIRIRSQVFVQDLAHGRLNRRPSGAFR